MVLHCCSACLRHSSTAQRVGDVGPLVQAGSIKAPQEYHVTIKPLSPFSSEEVVMHAWKMSLFPSLFPSAFSTNFSTLIPFPVPMVWQ